MRRFTENIRHYGAWIALSILGVVVAFQLRAALIYLGLFMVQRPFLRPMGWSTSTIGGLDRFVILVLGICWLLMVAFLETHLREDGRGRAFFWRRVGRFGLILVAVYALSYLFMLVLSLF